MKTTLFALESFDWRTIAASHPAGCACLSCAAVRAEQSDGDAQEDWPSDAGADDREARRADAQEARDLCDVAPTPAFACKLGAR